MIFPSIHLSILPTRFVNGIICSTSTRACDMPPLPWLQEKWRLRYLIFYANAYNWQQNIRNITKFKKSSVKCFKMMLKTSTSCFEQIDPKWRLVGEEILGSYFCIISWVIYSTNYGITLFILCCLWNTHISPGSITIFLLVQVCCLTPLIRKKILKYWDRTLALPNKTSVTFFSRYSAD